MTALLYIPVVLSLAVLGAHFMREGLMIGVAVAIALIGLLFLRREWVPRVMQTALLVGAFEWVLTLYTLAEMRVASGGSATRLIVILVAVIVVTLTSAYLFETERLKKIYFVNSGEQNDA